MKTNEETNTDGRRFEATGVQNVLRCMRHAGDKEGGLMLLVKRGGKRIKRALGTNDLKLASKRAAELIAEMDGARAAGHFGELPKMRGQFAPLPRVFAAYLESATIEVKARNVKALVRVLKLAGRDPGGSSEQLNAETVRLFILAMAKAAGDDQRQQVRAAVSSNSYMRQARSLFAAHVLPAYLAASVNLPDLASFMKAPKADAPAVQYVEPPAAVIKRIGTEYPQLHDTDPGAYAWFLLGAFVGLRNNEVRVAEWSWVEVDGVGKHWLRLASRPHWRSKTSRGRDVEIPPAVLAELHALRGVEIDGVPAEISHLVPAHHKTERNVRALRRLNLWLRARGLTQDSFPKGYYELRKYFGNVRTWQTGDRYQTARVMGNSPEVVEKYYSGAGGRAPITIPAPAASTRSIRKAARALAVAGAAPISA